MEKVIREAAEYAKGKLESYEAGHSWQHTERVWNLARKISSVEGGNMLVIELAALFHDVYDHKFCPDMDKGLDEMEVFLFGLGLGKDDLEHVKEIVRNVSFSGKTRSGFSSKELSVVQDADRLDGIGAIGIARTFAYGGYHNRMIYDTAIKPKIDMTKEEYIKEGKDPKSTSINHFYEKLLLVKDRINTCTGKKMAEKRHGFMLDYLDEFFSEWKDAE